MCINIKYETKNAVDFGEKINRRNIENIVITIKRLQMNKISALNSP